MSTRVNFSLNELPPIQSFHSSVDLSAIVSRTERLLYTLADAAVAVDSATGGDVAGSGDAAVQKSGGWFGFISEAMEVVLKVSCLYFLFNVTLLYNNFGENNYSAHFGYVNFESAKNCSGENRSIW